MKEFEFIKELTKKLPEPNIDLGIGDDAACMGNILISKDIAAEDVHFTLKASIKDIIFKIITANVSDICAMGGTAKYILLGISIPKDKINPNELIDAISYALTEYNLTLIGGDTTSSIDKLFISVTVIGEKNKYLLKRKGAKPGDLLYLSREIGLNKLSLEQEIQSKNYDLENFIHYRMKAETELAQQLGNCKYITSCIDISDSLISETQHIAKNSDITFIIDKNKLPLKKLSYFTKQPLDIFFTSGEEYALLFTVDINGINFINNLEKTLKRKLYCIGKVTNKSRELIMLKDDGNSYPVKKYGFEHEF